jgi:hypothetical protein
MHSTLIELLQSIVCAIAFAIILLPPGYLAARFSNLNGFRKRSAAEQTLWSVALSLPLAILLAELLGRVLAPSGVLAIFFALALTAVGLVCIDANKKTSTPPARISRETYLAATAALILAAYLLLTLLDIQVGNKLFVPTVLTDWGVRVPLMESAIRGPVPPLNPLSALNGPPTSLRYYYFWYVLCAVPARLMHTHAGSALAASGVWAGFALLAVSFLLLKYFVSNTEPIRRRCLQLFLPMLVIGLDILPTIAIFLHRASNPYLDIEWWHADRTPALLTALVYAPHHIGGLVCCFVAYLVLVAEPEQTTPFTQWTFGNGFTRALLAGIAFAACVGTSTFIAFIFVIASLLWTIDLLRTKQFGQIGTLAGSGAFAYLFSRPFLHELKSGSSAAHGFAGFAWRSGSYLDTALVRHHIFASHPVAAFLAKQPAVLTLDFCELGFFLFVALFQIRRELLPALRGQRTLTLGQRALWAIFFGTVIAWLFISSSATSSGNDLGAHAGMLVRFILVLWSPTYLQQLWTKLRSLFELPLRHRIVPALAATCLLLGLAGGMLDAVLHRVYIPLFDAGLMKRPAGTLVPDHLGERFLAARTMWRELDATLPTNARVQFSPSGPMQQGLARYSNRQIVAFDGGCGTAFGGDYDRCAPVRAELRHLFDDEDDVRIIDGTTIPAQPQSIATAADFAQTCRDLALSAIIVESTDRVWNQQGSWVRTLQPAIAEPTVRAYRCPTN